MEPDREERSVVHTSMAVVTAEASARFAKQLLSHVGRKARVQPLDGSPEGGQLVFAYGIGTIRPEVGRLVLRASAADLESLARVEDVLGRHLVRFGARQGLTVSWQRDAGPQTALDPATSEPARAAGSGQDGESSAAPLVQVIHSDDAPAHSGPVPQAVAAGGWIYVSALFGVDPATRAIPADAHAEAGQLFTNLAAILAAGGADLSNVVRVGIFMRDLQRDRPVFNEVWASRFGEHRPARAAIQSADFGRAGENARYMIVVAAYLG
jgi:reactive intermediate/imine deaminase